MKKVVRDCSLNPEAPRETPSVQGRALSRTDLFFQVFSRSSITNPTPHVQLVILQIVYCAVIYKYYNTLRFSLPSWDIAIPCNAESSSLPPNLQVFFY